MSYSRVLRAPLELWKELRVPLRVAVEDSGLHLSHGRELNFFSSWGATHGSSCVVMGPPLMMSWGDWPIVGMCRLASLLLQCAGDCSLVLAWDFSLDMVRVNSVVVVSSIPSSCGLLAPV